MAHVALCAGLASNCFLYRRCVGVAPFIGTSSAADGDGFGRVSSPSIRPGESRGRPVDSGSAETCAWGGRMARWAQVVRLTPQSTVQRLERGFDFGFTNRIQTEKGRMSPSTLDWLWCVYRWYVGVAMACWCSAIIGTSST